MKNSSLKSKILLLLLCCAVIVSGGLLTGCKGSDGGAGAAGTNGTDGTDGTNGRDAITGVVDAKTFTYDDLRNIHLGGKILSASTASNQPVVTFQVTNADSGEGIIGLRTFSLHIAQLKPELNGSNAYWLNYILNSDPRPTTDGVTTYNTDGTVKVQGYQVVDNLDSTYTVTFKTDIKSIASVPYDATLPHRIVVGVRSVAVPGVVGKTAGAYAGPINPVTGLAFAQFTNTNGVNLVIDFIPSTGEVLTTPSRDLVTIAACNQCHYKLQYGSNNTSGHFGSRTDTKTCVVCHTPQNIVSGQTATTNADFNPLIHKIHMGEELPLPETQVGINLNEITYPQNVRNCATCHNGVLADNWKTKPSRKACGSCHNNVDFANDIHPSTTGSIRTDDSMCQTCHDALAIATYHLPVSKNSDTTSSSFNVKYANNNYLPAGAYKIEYVVSGVTVSADNTPSVDFQIKVNDAAVSFGTYSATANPNLVPNTTSGVTIAFAYSQTQDGITNPADFNSRMSITLGPGNPTVSKTGVYTAPAVTTTLWGNNGAVDSYSSSTGTTSWTLTGPTADNTYTVKCTTPLPASATMLTAGVYGAFVQTNLTGTYEYVANNAGDFTNYSGTSWRITKPGLVIAPAVATKAYTGTGFTARRTIVDNAKCKTCHDQLGAGPIFHGGARNDGTMCNFCHTPNGSYSDRTTGAPFGWSYSFNTFVHAIHASGKRAEPYTFTADYSAVTYPGVLRNCTQCHASGDTAKQDGSCYTGNTFDYTCSTRVGSTKAVYSETLLSSLLLNTVATGTTIVAGTYTSPYIAQTAGTYYGSAFAYSTTTGTATDATNDSLVVSPITASCFSCHDTSAAIAHMEANGGSVYDTRGNAKARSEQCLVCHGPAANTAYGDFVPAIRAVHRWW